MAVITSSTQNCKTVTQTSNVYAAHISLCHSEIWDFWVTSDGALTGELLSILYVKKVTIIYTWEEVQTSIQSRIGDDVGFKRIWSWVG